MNAETPPRSRNRTIVLILVVSLILGVLYGGVIIVLAPKVFESKVTMKLDKALLENEHYFAQGKFKAKDLRFSDQVLLEVSDALYLPSRWEMGSLGDAAVLTGVINIQAGENDDLIDISVKYQVKTDASEIAAEIPKSLERVWQRYRLRELKENHADRAREELEQRDLLSAYLRRIRTILSNTGATNLEAETVTEDQFVEFLDSLPETNQVNRQEALAAFKDAIGKREETKKSLTEFLEEPEEASKGFRSPFEIHTGPSLAEPVHSVDIPEALLIGARNGLVFGGCLIGLAYLFFWKGEGDEPEKPKKIRTTDPDNPW